MPSPFEVFQRAVESKGLKVTNSRDKSFVSQCPTHDDGSPSLSVGYRDGKVLVMCHAGCDTRDIVADLGLDMRELFEEEPSDKNSMVVAKYPYADGVTGEVLFWHVRLFPKTFRFMHYDRSGKEVWTMPRDVQPWLYHAADLKMGLDRGDVIWLVEGESDVHAMESLGAVATTSPFGAGPGKWKPFHTNLLRRAAEVRIVVDLDEDRPDGKNPGRDYAFEVRDALVGAGVKVSLWKSASGKDAADHVKAGFGLEDFRKYDMPRQRVAGVSGADLMEKEFKPLIFAIDGILPQGVAILGAGPKTGKSFVALDMSIAVATGGRSMSLLNATLGDVLYVGLEDSERRLRDRINLLCEGHVPDLSRIEFQTIDSGWEGGDRGLAWMEEWASEAESPRLVVLDTLGKVEPDLDSNKNRYLAEQEMMLKYKRFADRHDLTVLFVHHDRKSEDDDWLNKFSGTKGITGGADTLLYMDCKRGERQGTLRVEGRDVVAGDIPIRKFAGRPFWVAEDGGGDYSDVDEPQQVKRSVTERQAHILAALRDMDGHSPLSDLEGRVEGMTAGEVKMEIERLTILGHLRVRDGEYHLVG